jgi:hypothetical protein
VTDLSISHSPRLADSGAPGSYPMPAAAVQAGQRLAVTVLPRVAVRSRPGGDDAAMDGDEAPSERAMGWTGTGWRAWSSGSFATS